MSTSTTKRVEREHLSNVYATVTSLKMFPLMKVLADGILFVIFLTITIINPINPPSTVIRVINADLFSIRLYIVIVHSLVVLTAVSTPHSGAGEVLV